MALQAGVSQVGGRPCFIGTMGQKIAKSLRLGPRLPDLVPQRLTEIDGCVL
jgi:hypothetical protein